MVPVASFFRSVILILIRKYTQAHSIALLFKDIHQGCNRKNCKSDLVEVLKAEFLYCRIIHRGRIIQDHMTAKIRLFFISLGVQLVCFGKQFPVDMLCTFAGVIDLMFSKFSRESVEGTFVNATDKSFDYLIGKQFEI